MLYGKTGGAKMQQVAVDVILICQTLTPMHYLWDLQLSFTGALHSHSFTQLKDYFVCLIVCISCKAVSAIVYTENHISLSDLSALGCEQSSIVHLLTLQFCFLCQTYFVALVSAIHSTKSKQLYAVTSFLCNKSALSFVLAFE